MTEVDDHAHTVHLLDHLDAELGETLVLIGCVSRTVADLIVIAVAEGDVVDATVVIALDVREIGRASCRERV